MAHQMVAIVLAGGQGTRLAPLTDNRAKPAVPIAGKFRLVDIAMSNCLHSGIRQMFVLTQFASESLHRHINQTYFFPPWSNGFAQILAAQQTVENTSWYQGTADAVRQNLTYLNNREFEHYLILSGDHLYRMDYRDMLRTHLNTEADVTVSVIPVARQEASEFGVLKAEMTGRVSDFYEKPDTEELLNQYSPNKAYLQANGFDNAGSHMLASMGIYLFSRKALFGLLEGSDESDFGRGIFPSAIKEHRVFAHFFNDYWEDIGTIRAFYQAMIDLTNPKPRFDFYEEPRPVITHARFLPGARIDACQIEKSVICDAARMLKATIRKSIIGVRSRVRAGATLDHVVMMGADYMEDHIELGASSTPDSPFLGIGEDTVIEKAIIDKNARIGRNVRMKAQGRPKEAQEANYVIRDGVLIIPKSAVIPDGTIIGV